MYHAEKRWVGWRAALAAGLYPGSDGSLWSWRAALPKVRAATLEARPKRRIFSYPSRIGSRPEATAAVSGRGAEGLFSLLSECGEMDCGLALRQSRARLSCAQSLR